MRLGRSTEWRYIAWFFAREHLARNPAGKKRVRVGGYAPLKP
jgi:hypothetical protein